MKHDIEIFRTCVNKAGDNVTLCVNIGYSTLHPIPGGTIAARGVLLGRLYVMLGYRTYGVAEESREEYFV